MDSGSKLLFLNLPDSLYNMIIPYLHQLTTLEIFILTAYDSGILRRCDSYGFQRQRVTTDNETYIFNLVT